MTSGAIFPFRLVSGFRPIGGLHLGHYGGVLKDILVSQDTGIYTTFVFIADYHVRSKWRHPSDLIDLDKSTFELTRQLLAVGICPTKTVLYRQSDLPEIFEVMWLLAGLATDSNLRRMHAFRNSSAPSVGTYLYPLLMAADILVTKATHVAIGSDQKQHVELVRDISRKLIDAFGVGFVPLPNPFQPSPITIRGTDSLETGLGKMSIENENEIPIFEPQDVVSDRIDRIMTHPVRYGEPLPDANCLILEYAMHLSRTRGQKMRENYSTGRYGYSDAKNELKALFFETFDSARSSYSRLTDQDASSALIIGRDRVREHAAEFILELRSRIGRAP